MKTSLFCLSFFLSLTLGAQKTKNDPEISHYVKQVSKDSLKINVEKLVSFGF